ncbi:transcription antitermination factor NusB [Aquisphaera insulae]|uniref:transcription antitermination factor NusB n=1 Tax=Aquisphaera insulae TaxID=2712864 RepID=UPI0013ECDC0E|nr:transcription antitermination factor NusB [Aquisphaera insulae]
MTRRSRGREVALQVLYQVEQNSGLPAVEIRQFINRRLLGEARLVEFTQALIGGVREHQPRIDAMIEEVAENWRLDRMAAIDRNILRLGAYEVLYGPDEVPAKVAINEALELAKRYSTAQSSRFVNGILDRVLQLHEESKAKADAPAEPEVGGQTAPKAAGDATPQAPPAETAPEVVAEAEPAS